MFCCYVWKSGLFHLESRASSCVIWLDHTYLFIWWWLFGVAKWSYNIRNMFFHGRWQTLMFKLARFRSQRISFWITFTYLLKTCPHSESTKKNHCLTNVSPSDVIFSKNLDLVEFHNSKTRWWIQIFFMFTPIWGRFPFWLIFFNQMVWNHQVRKTSCLSVSPTSLAIWCAMFLPGKLEAWEEVPCTCFGDAQHETWSKARGLFPLGSDW